MRQLVAFGLMLNVASQPVQPGTCGPSSGCSGSPVAFPGGLKVSPTGSIDARGGSRRRLSGVKKATLWGQEGDFLGPRRRLSGAKKATLGEGQEGDSGAKKATLGEGQEGEPCAKFGTGLGQEGDKNYSGTLKGRGRMLRYILTRRNKGT